MATIRQLLTTNSLNTTEFRQIRSLWIPTPAIRKHCQTVLGGCPATINVARKRNGLPTWEEVEGPETAERAGVVHMVHAWHQLGTCQDDLIGLSGEMLEGGTKPQATNHIYFKVTEEATIHVAQAFKAIFPQYYEHYEAAFKAGVWYTEDRGPFLAWAVVYKLLVYMHMDGLDNGPTLTCPAGFFKGGEMYYPDIDVVYQQVQYKSGDMCLSMSATLYHAVGKWTPTPVPQELATKRIMSRRTKKCRGFDRPASEVAPQIAVWNGFPP
ncbi:hypothetical protein C8J57DRAFT_1484478 [Mycena rebaudengoi]|nr:hypothetical protein C8J57DRAFT_1484478 [Mycena rebaudengoi]